MTDQAKDLGLIEASGVEMLFGHLPDHFFAEINGQRVEFRGCLTGGFEFYCLKCGQPKERGYFMNAENKPASGPFCSDCISLLTKPH